GTRCDLPWAISSRVTRESVHPVQIYESLLLFALGFFLWKNESLRLNARRSVGGAGIYLVAYSLIRFALEFLRGDETRGNWGPLSTSQWISIPLFVGGVWLIRGEIIRGRVRR
ncbi:MAG: prolipoprotein diacylglyceryl transferase family protein, partial [Bdellovibrionota bacterium]